MEDGFNDLVWSISVDKKKNLAKFITSGLGDEERVMIYMALKNDMANFVFIKEIIDAIELEMALRMRSN